MWNDQGSPKWIGSSNCNVVGRFGRQPIKLRIATAFLVLAMPARATPPAPAALAEVDHIFADRQIAAHVPSLVYGVVADGRLVAVHGFGVQDTAINRVVTADSLFRIASMSKAFTALAVSNLREGNKLAIDAPAEAYVPELKGWTYPTSDSPRITVRNLLTHSAGLVEDNPWGDRQQPLPEGTAVRTAIEAAGASLLYLPLYSPDFNPSRRPSRNSKPSSAKPQPAPLMHCGASSAKPSTLSHQPNVQTTSLQQVTIQSDRLPLEAYLGAVRLMVSRDRPGANLRPIELDEFS